MKFLAQRSDALELMDQPDRVSRADLVGSLKGIKRVNRWLGGTRLSLRYLAPLIMKAHRAGANPVRICDIGTGAGDIPVAVVRWARRRKIKVHVVAVELSPPLAAAARNAAKKYPEATIVEGDARSILRAAAEERETLSGHSKSKQLPANAEPFDIVTANLFLHHFTPDEVTAWMGLMHRASRFGFVVNDLERAFWPWFGIRFFGWMISRNNVFLHDAPLSVRRSYTQSEWKQLARSAGLRRATVRPHWAGRVVVKDSSER